MVAVLDRPWLVAYPPDVPADVEVPDEPLFAELERAGRDHPHRPAIDFLGRVLDWAELVELVHRTAAGLRRLGMGEGARVVLLFPNSPYAVIFYHAVLEAGGVVVHASPLYSIAELERLVRDADAHLLATVDLALTLPKAGELLARGWLERVIVCPLADAMPRTTGLLFRLFARRERARLDDARLLSFRDLLAGREPFRPAIPAPGDPAVLQYTGGTTGVPKGAMLTHRNLVANRAQVLALDPELVVGEERILGVLPLFHVFAMTAVMNVAVGMRACMILLPRFVPEQTLRVLHRRRPTLFPVVPALLQALLRSPALHRYRLDSLRFCISGGAPLPREVQERFEQLTGCRVVEGYGLTEASPVVTCNPPTGRVVPGSIGIPLPSTWVEIRALDDPRRRLPPGEKGELVVRGPQVMRGYWKRPAETREVFVDGWLRTGDVGWMDGDGYVHLVDRIKDLILVRGYNVYPRLVEEALYAHEAVAEAVVIGVPDPERGEVPKAFVVRREGFEVDAETLRAFLRERLAPYEVPREIEFRAELPRTPIGKPSRRDLVEEERRRRGEGGER